MKTCPATAEMVALGGNQNPSASLYFAALAIWMQTRRMKVNEGR